VRWRKRKGQNAEVVKLLRSILEQLDRIEKEIIGKQKTELLPAKILDVDSPLSDEATIT
jgi:hypothetical protein